MSRVFVTSDWHLGHRNILKYRPQFSSIEEHDALLIHNYNAVISKRDTIYFLGDICFDLGAVETIRELKGRKVLVLGNHDLERGFDKRILHDTFNNVVSLISKNGCWLSHAPIHPDELRGKYNIHGHTHNSSIQDVRYANVCVENTNYTPALLQDIKTIIESGQIYKGN